MQKKICLVVPTIRESSFKQFVERWDALKLFDHVDLFIIEDNPKRTFETPSQAWAHHSWGDIEDRFPIDGKSWIIPRRSDTVRSWGYYSAWREGYEYILTLDDDCYPPTEADGLVYQSGEAFVQEHLNAIEKRTRWFNTLNSVKPRGIPFYGTGELSKVVANHGLWTNVLDYDAPTQLVSPVKEKFSFDNRIVPANLYFPMCGMNVMWRRDWTVCMYHLLMGQVIDRLYYDPEPDPIQGPTIYNKLEKLPFDRFGDIWCGIIMKKIADANNLNVATGMPYIRHERASNPFTNLKKEANGLEVNETFWEYVDKVVLRSQDSLPQQYRVMGYHIGIWNAPAEYKGYFERLGEAMQTWAELFE